MKFKVGDRVQIRSWDEMKEEFGVLCSYIDGTPYFSPHRMKHLCGKQGVVIKVDNTEYFIYYTIRFDDGTDTSEWKITSYMLKHATKKYTIDDTLKSMADDVISIYRDGNKVVLKYHQKNGNTVETIAKCHPDDKFDFMAGAALAFERLKTIDVGDTVKLTDKYNVYCFQTDWIKKYAPEYAMFYAYGVDLDFLNFQIKSEVFCKDDTFKVLAKGKDIYIDKMLYLIQSLNKACYLVDEASISKVSYE